MKKFLVFMICMGGLAGGIWGLSHFRLKSFLDGEKEAVEKGDLVIPVTANGLIEPDKFIQIKSKAGGQVQEIRVAEGNMVKAGDILLTLDPVDERRNVEAREADVERAKSALEKAKIALDNVKQDLPLQTKLAAARLEDSRARFAEADYRWGMVKDYIERDIASKTEKVTQEMAFNVAKASVEMAETELSRSQNNEEIGLKSAQQDVVQAAATLDTTEKNLDEAKQRLAETTVRTKSDGMVYSITIRPGEMVQSGTQSFTGGTPLMMLADTTSMFVMAQVDEADIGAIREIAPEYAKPGQTQTLTTQQAIDFAHKVVDADDLSKAEKADKAEKDAADKFARDTPAVKNLVGRIVRVTVEAYRGEEYKGVIERILPEPQSLSNVITFKVRVRLVGEDLKKLLALQADLEFTTEKLHNVTLVKNDALVSEGRDVYVYIPYRKNESDPWGEQKKQVKIGKTDGTFTQIISGIDPGQEVWTKRPKLTEKEQKQAEGSI